MVSSTVQRDIPHFHKFRLARIFFATILIFPLFHPVKKKKSVSTVCYAMRELMGDVPNHVLYYPQGAIPRTNVCFRNTLSQCLMRINTIENIQWSDELKDAV